MFKHLMELVSNAALNPANGEPALREWVMANRGNFTERQVDGLEKGWHGILAVGIDGCNGLCPGHSFKDDAEFRRRCRRSAFAILVAVGKGKVRK